MAKLLTDEEIGKRLSGLEGWERRGDQIEKRYTLKNFKDALRFVNRVGELAEGMDHHPDILIHHYKNVTLTLTTHDAKGLTRLDFDLAERIESAFQNLTVNI